MRYNIAIFVVTFGLASAAPLEDRSTKAAACFAVDLVVDVLRLYPSASPFCSSVLRIPTITTTKTVSSTVSYTSALTTTIPTTVLTVTTVADPVVEYSTIETTITTCIPSAVNKRAISNVGSCGGAPGVLKNIACSAITSACSCLGIPTRTSTVTSTQVLFTTAHPTSTVYSSITATVTVTGTTTIPTTSTSTVNFCPVPSSCDNAGIQWAHYYNGENNNIGNGDDYYSNYDPTVIKSLSPDYQSSALVIGGLDQDYVSQLSIYGSSQTFASDFFTLNHVGYIFAQVTGTYTFTLSNTDDITLLWLGPTAISGWNRGNADAVSIYSSVPSAQAEFYLVQGQYLPFRIVFGNAQGAIKFFVQVAAPDGTVVLDSNTQDSKFLIQYSCDGTSAPRFPAFGAEA
ncbi:hypothetical protein D6D01_05293 [Aureobasidium pullulans]|uniref:PA14 domain-containing protein n=1 Tax=Aureobasidium pullulans TaxID=5580 RepID=A0A4V4JVB1_AURPU|nr:hypothetical protein D6D01_05293 [Aureobasidium pullulans]